MKDALYFEDFEVGQRFASGNFTVEPDEAVGFARIYDPQYLHTDEQAAQQGPFGRIIASGWQTAAISMRLKLDTPLANVAGGLVGLGLEGVKWPKAVYPGDMLRIDVTIAEKRDSRSRPTHGIMKYKVETFNQHGEMVMEMVPAVLVPKR